MSPAAPFRAPADFRAIDIHAHIVVPEVFDTTSAHALVLAQARDPSLPEEARERNRRQQMETVRRMADTAERIGQMDGMRVGRQVLSPSLVHQCTYILDRETSLKLERLSNDRMAELVAEAPDRFSGLGTVPLSEPDLAVQELRRCRRELGLRGVTISTFAGGREIGHPDLHPFWREAAETGALVYVHPAGNRTPRFQQWVLWNSVGQCFEETMAIASLIYEGVLERFPSLKICISHGGGYMPHNMGRIDRNWLEKPATRVNMTKPPADYLRMLWFDSCVYDDAILANLIAKVGADRVVLGSDYPVGDKQPVTTIEKAGFDAATRDAILWGNAEKLLAE
ncbi:MAG TPA: amidohydrolase family protein [Stellaceae bacterium]|jgi:aminocarboxymuconate-semialdehyde decarboxylase|nr:amidohydrolase family protein [Stellaceae bacterium]